MKHVALTPFGAQPVTAAQLSARDAVRRAPPPPAVIDKWSVFNDLRIARKTLGVSDRDLGVLHALLSFLPGKELAPEAPLTVFPSNRALCDRAHGMAESTLRRHLAALVEAGLIWRNDSPNGKRFARRDESGALSQAYGFDLSPLLMRSMEIAELAASITTAEAQRHLARERLVLLLRDATKLFAHARESGEPLPDAALIEAQLFDLRGHLRRKLDLSMLQDLEAATLALLARIYPQTEELSATAAQNERHPSESDKEFKESEESALTFNPNHMTEASETEKTTDPSPTLPLGLVIAACPELAPYAPEQPRSWQELVMIAERLHPMMGISPDLWREAKAAMGSTNAGITLAAMLQRFGEIGNPGGYLRSLSRRAAQGLFTPVRMVLALLHREDRVPG